MPTASTVVATTPFLTVDQVAAELGITPLGVRRLIALKLLPANRMVAETGEWKITPAALEQYARTDRKRMLMPALDAGWFDFREIEFAGEFFVGDVRTLLLRESPEECPLKDRDGANMGGSIAVRGSLLTEIAALARKPLKVGLRRQPNSPETEIPNYGTAFLVAELSKKTHSSVRKGKMPNVATPGGDVAVLFDSPESYRQHVNAGWETMKTAVLAASRIYPGARNPMVYFDVPYTAFMNAIGLSTVEPLTF